MPNGRLQQQKGMWEESNAGHLSPTLSKGPLSRPCLPTAHSYLLHSWWLLSLFLPTWGGEHPSFQPQSVSPNPAHTLVKSTLLQFLFEGHLFPNSEESHITRLYLLLRKQPISSIPEAYMLQAPGTQSPPPSHLVSPRAAAILVPTLKVQGFHGCLNLL